MQLSRQGGAFQCLGFAGTSGDVAAQVVDLQPRDRRSYWRVRCGVVRPAEVCRQRTLDSAHAARHQPDGIKDFLRASLVPCASLR